MKKVIGGKVYDTETAQKVGFWANAGSWRDFQHVEETLYRKKTGEFFLYGEGGPMTRYAKAIEQNSWSGGERIMPMSWAEAKEWAEEHLDGDEYEQIFGPVAEDESRVTIHLSISATAADTIKRRAAEQGITVGAYVEQLLAK